jgi:OOP family OmpA-OmpF porin
MKKVVLGALLAASSLPVLADNNVSIELLLGSAEQETDFPSGNSISGNDISVGVRGAFEINENIALELAYINYGDAEDVETSFGDKVTDTSTFKAISIGVKGMLPLTEDFSLNARVGFSKWDFEVEESYSSTPGFVFKGDDSGTDLTFGLGMEYDINDDIFVGFEYSITDVEIKVEAVEVDHIIKNFGLSIGYNF